MSVQNVRSFDLDLARALSRRLSASKRQTTPPAPASPTYVRFAAVSPPAPSSRRATLAPGQLAPAPLPTPTPAAVAPVAPVVPPPPPSPRTVHPIDSDHVDSWEQFLAWCSLNANIESAFVVDSQGFVIGQHGQLSSEQCDGVGAELSLAMEQLARIEALHGELGSAVLGFGTRILIGFRGNLQREEFVLGIVATDPIPAEVMQAVGTSFRDVLPRLG